VACDTYLDLSLRPLCVWCRAFREILQIKFLDPVKPCSNSFDFENAKSGVVDPANTRPELGATKRNRNDCVTVNFLPESGSGISCQRSLGKRTLACRLGFCGTGKPLLLASLKALSPFLFACYSRIESIATQAASRSIYTKKFENSVYPISLGCRTNAAPGKSAAS
jgi:hypothetical protein